MESITIKSARQAMAYAKSKFGKDEPYPRYVFMDRQGHPAERGEAHSLIVITKRRSGTGCAPCGDDVTLVEALRAVAHSTHLLLVDYIIVGSDGYFSFAEERIRKRV